MNDGFFKYIEDVLNLPMDTIGFIDFISYSKNNQIVTLHFETGEMSISKSKYDDLEKNFKVINRDKKINEILE